MAHDDPDRRATGAEDAPHRRVRVAVVDDHAIIRDTIRLALESDRRIELVGTACSASEALSVARSTAPDVIVLDDRLPDAEAPDLIRALREQGCGAEVVVLSSSGDRRNVRASLDSGARAFLTKKETDFDLLSSAVIAAAAGRDTLSDDALSELIRSIRERSSPRAQTLTSREEEIWRLVSLGKNNSEIAGNTFISERTVKYHVGNLLQKTGARTRAELVAMAYRTGVMDATA